jgi:hypothetical protein
MLRKLGATHIFDYTGYMVVNQVSNAVNGLHLASSYSISDGLIITLTAVQTKQNGLSTTKSFLLASSQPGGGTVNLSNMAKTKLLGTDTVKKELTVVRINISYPLDGLACKRFVVTLEITIMGK